MAEFPKYEEMCKNVAEKALDEFLYDGKSIREWMQIIASSDAISRTEVKRIVDFYKEQTDGIYRINESIDNLSPVTPQPKTDWIPISERLPEIFQRVLVTIVNYKGNKVVRVAEYYNRKVKGVFQIKENHEEWEVGEKGLLAWMPLPEPYKSESIELLIKIPEEDYKSGNVMASAIRNGTILPKGHGRLIDADAFIETMKDASKRQKYKEVLIDDCLTVDDVFKAIIESLQN